MADFKTGFTGFARGAQSGIRSLSDIQRLRESRQRQEQEANRFDLKMQDLRKGEEKLDLVSLQAALDPEEGQFLTKVAMQKGYVAPDGSIKRKYADQLMSEVGSNPFLKVQFEDVLIEKYRMKISESAEKLRKLREDSKEDTPAFQNLQAKAQDYTARLNKLLGQKDETLDNLTKLQQLRNLELEGQKKAEELQRGPDATEEAKKKQDLENARLEGDLKRKKLNEPDKEKETSTADIAKLQTAIVKSLYDESGNPIVEPRQADLTLIQDMAGKMGYEIKWSSKPVEGFFGVSDEGGWELVKKEGGGKSESGGKPASGPTDTPPDAAKVSKTLQGKIPGTYNIDKKWKFTWDGTKATLVK